MTVRTVFMGSDRFSVPVLRAVLEHAPELRERLEVVGAVTQPDRPSGRGRRITLNPVKTVALEHGLIVLQPTRLRSPEAMADVRALDPALIVVASYGQIVPQPVLDMPRHRCLNLHPSLLPLYRGPNPVGAPILAGDRVTGVSLMLMTARMDAGPILDQRQTEIGEDETAGELEARLACMSGQVLLSALPGWIRGSIVPLPQVEEEATYTAKVRKEDGLLDWSLAAELLSRRVRAFNPWPGAFTFWNGRMLRVLGARAEPGRAKPGSVQLTSGLRLCVGTGDGLLEVVHLQLAGGRAQPAAEFVRGHRDLVGAILTSQPPWL